MSRKTVSLFLALLMLFSMTASLAEGSGITVTDMYGREVTLNEPATRIVVMQPSDCEILCAIGCEDAIVGRGQYVDYPASILEVPVVQSGENTNIEEILALEPQVVLMNDMGQSEEQVRQLEDNGVKVVVSKAADIEGVYYAIRMIGKLMGKDDAAEAVIADMQATFDESETLSAKAATVEAEKLQAGVFKNYNVGLLHGKLAPDVKDKVMEDFKNHKYDVLVCTTVVEVGVDVPNATVMIIENAERFGLSQLHQLRGRVGRGDAQSYCILLSSNRNVETMSRLKIMTQTNNGFVIEQKDLEIRGPGEYLGTRQSGEIEFGVADLIKDTKLLEKAREYAIDFIKHKNINDFPALKDKLFAAKASSFEVQVG